jgi:hypothetical protein
VVLAQVVLVVDILAAEVVGLVVGLAANILVMDILVVDILAAEVVGLAVDTKVPVAYSGSLEPQVVDSFLLFVPPTVVEGWHMPVAWALEVRANY